MKYVIVTESGADIPQREVDRLGLQIVPMHVTFGSKNVDDGIYLSERIFDHFAATGELPSTSGCTPGDFSAAFDRVHQEHADAHIIYLAYSAVTTCSYESARAAAEGRDYVSMLDTKSVSAGQYMVVTEIAQYIAQNPEATVEQVMERAQECVDKIRMAFVPGELDFLRAGGRLSNVAFLGAMLLRIKPIVEILDGRLVATQKKRGAMDSVVKAALSDFLNREDYDLRRVALIRNRGLSPDIQEYVEKAVLEAGFKEFCWINTGGVISSHCGPGSWGISAFVS